MTLLVHFALTALLAAADPAFDTVFLQNGGRVRGLVLEEDPGLGVTIQLPDGTIRKVTVPEVARVEYRDGTIGVLKPAAPAAPSGPTASPPPASPAPPGSPAPPASPTPPGSPAPPDPYAPPPPPAYPPASGAEAPPQGVPPPRTASPPPPPGAPPYGPGRPYPYGYYPPRQVPRAQRPPSTAPAVLMLAGGMGVASPSGSLEPGVPMSDYVSPQFLMEVEGGLRFTPRIMGSLLMDIGVGDVGTVRRADCRMNHVSCAAATVRLGVQLRYAFTPYAAQTGWVAIGTGFEATALSDGQTTNGTNDLTYSGWEAVRVSTGIDLRASHELGWGFFLTAGFGRYNQVDDPAVSNRPLAISHTSGHAWVQGGVRLILWP
jgi:hypothetical protein